MWLFGEWTKGKERDGDLGEQVFENQRARSKKGEILYKQLLIVIPSGHSLRLISAVYPIVIKSLSSSFREWQLCIGCVHMCVWEAECSNWSQTKDWRVHVHGNREWNDWT